MMTTPQEQLVPTHLVPHSHSVAELACILLSKMGDGRWGTKGFCVYAFCLVQTRHCLYSTLALLMFVKSATTATTATLSLYFGYAFEYTNKRHTLLTMLLTFRKVRTTQTQQQQQQQRSDRKETSNNEPLTTKNGNM